MVTATRSGNNLGQPTSPRPADQQMSPQQVRDLFLQTAFLSSIQMDPITWTPGSTINIKVPQTGVACKIRLLVSIAPTVATATVTPNSRSPFILIPNVTYTDPAGNVRINASGYDLYLLQISKPDWDFDPSSGSAGTWLSSATVAGQVFQDIATGAGVRSVQFFVDLPLSMGDRDTRGSMLLESATSPSFISVTMPTLAQMVSAAASTEFSYNSATGSISGVTGTITPVYYFWRPTWVDLGGQRVLPLPVDDFNLIHEVISLRSSAAMVTNGDNRFTLPTGRSYYRLVGQYVNNAAFAGSATDVTAVRFQIDQSTFTLNESIQAYYSRTRYNNSRDMPLGTFLWDLADRPLDSSHYGQLDAILGLGTTALVNPYLAITRDTLHVAPVA